VFRRELTQPVVRRDVRIGIDADERYVVEFPDVQAGQEMRQHRLIEETGVKPEDDFGVFRGGFKFVILAV